MGEIYAHDDSFAMCGLGEFVNIEQLTGVVLHSWEQGHFHVVALLLYKLEDVVFIEQMLALSMFLLITNKDACMLGLPAIVSVNAHISRLQQDKSFLWRDSMRSKLRFGHILQIKRDMMKEKLINNPPNLRYRKGMHGLRS